MCFTVGRLFNDPLTANWFKTRRPACGPLFCSEERHAAREQKAEARITYRVPAEIVRVWRRLERGGATFLVLALQRFRTYAEEQWSAREQCTIVDEQLLVDQIPFASDSLMHPDDGDQP